MLMNRQINLVSFELYLLLFIEVENDKSKSIMMKYHLKDNSYLL